MVKPEKVKEAAVLAEGVSIGRIVERHLRVSREEYKTAFHLFEKAGPAIRIDF
jgi:hypothetical protein